MRRSAKYSLTGCSSLRAGIAGAGEISKSIGTSPCNKTENCFSALVSGPHSTKSAAAR